MAKLGNIFKGNIFRITGAPHGEYQDDKALDGSGVITLEVIAPCDVEVKKQLWEGKTPYFYIFNSNWKILLLHCKLLVKPGIYRKGTVIGTVRYTADNFPDHLHVAIQLTHDGSSRWYTILDFMDRSIELRLSPDFKPTEQKWGKWGTYPDRQLQIIDLFPKTKPIQKPSIDKDALLTKLQNKLDRIKLIIEEK